MGSEEIKSYYKGTFWQRISSKSLEGIVSVVNDAIIKVKPKKASVELGIKIGLEAGHLTAMIVKGTGEANLKIVLEW
ncbi:MAG: hypothetical protein D3923_01765 [Candidatus Electrothrix sp. AR3]|nr:hypothetical protein [Candidatus Electrothrix sp. AR3]